MKAIAATTYKSTNIGFMDTFDNYALSFYSEYELIVKQTLQLCLKR